MLSRMRIDTGVDLDRAIATAHWLEERFGRRVPGLLTKAGTFPAAKETHVSYRLGHRRRGHLHGPPAGRREERPHLERQGAEHAERPVGRRAERPRPHLQARRHRSARDRPRDAWHDRRDQHRADELRRESRPGDDERLPPGAADRPLLRAGRPRRLGDLQQVAADGAAGAHHRGRRARGCARRRGAAARRGGAARFARETEEREDRGAHGLAHQCLRERRARAAHPRDRGRGAAGRAGVALLRGRAGDAGVRAHGNDRREFLRATGGAALHHATSRTSSPPGPAR